MTKTSTTTADLIPGQSVAVPGTLNSFPFTATVQSVKPWILTAGPKAGQQARSGRGKNAPLLFTVRLVDVTIDAADQPRFEDILADDAQRLMSVTMDASWDVLV